MKELLSDFKILNIYSYGSRVYGTNTDNSDYDYIIVVEGDNGLIDEKLIDEKNFSIYDIKSFQEAIDRHEISILECLNLPQEMVLMNERPFSYEIDLSKLRMSISSKTSNSWSKARKKLEVEKDFNPYIAKKSLFHVFRMFDFGFQLATTGKINDFSSTNHLWKEIKSIDSNDWKVFKERYQLLYNEYKSKFKILAPLERVD